MKWKNGNFRMFADTTCIIVQCMHCLFDNVTCVDQAIGRATHSKGSGGRDAGEMDVGGTRFQLGSRSSRSLLEIAMHAYRTGPTDGRRTARRRNNLLSLLFASDGGDDDGNGEERARERREGRKRTMQYCRHSTVRYVLKHESWNFCIQFGPNVLNSIGQ